MPSASIGYKPRLDFAGESLLVNPAVGISRKLLFRRERWTASGRGHRFVRQPRASFKYNFGNA